MTPIRSPTPSPAPQPLIILKYHVSHMATSAGSDVVPVRRTTKTRLAQYRTTTYDALLSDLLATSPAGLEARLALKAAEPANRALGLARPRTERTPAKQLLLAEVARERRRQWERQGRLVPLGPRRTRYIAVRPRPAAVVERVR